MASKSGKKSTSSSKNRRPSSKSRSQSRAYTAEESALFHEVGLIVLFALVVILFLCNFGLIGTAGNAVSAVMFGIFGWTAYVAPVLVFLAASFWYANQGSQAAALKLAAGVLLFLMAGVVLDLMSGMSGSLDTYDLKSIYAHCSENKCGGGILAGSIAYLFYHFLDLIGSVLVVLVFSVIGLVLLTQKSFVESVKKGGKRMVEYSREDSARRRENATVRRAQQEELRMQREERRAQREEEKRLRLEERENERLLRLEEKENEKILRMDKKVTGVMLDTALPRQQEEKIRDDIHEITVQDVGGEDCSEEIYAEDAYGEEIYAEDAYGEEVSAGETYGEEVFAEETYTVKNGEETSDEEACGEESFTEAYIGAEACRTDTPESGVAGNAQEEMPVVKTRPKAYVSDERKGGEQAPLTGQMQAQENRAPAKYIFPPIDCLKKGKPKSGDTSRELNDTAMRLKRTLDTFGVKVSITDISQGPTVTRYELQPEVGVKVSKIVGLADDIKLNLAATDIRIEAPIPGKAAIGIEVPNKENSPVALRDLLETKEFRDFPSNIAFAVGKDIGGKAVVSDIAKMPHMLIAGATGSGKSVCINTLIMSILYKAHPDDVKLIMVDPKVVELSVYNGIPHLLIPVVTDPKKAAAALNWGVAEMTDRYKKFAEYNVRDLKGYNQKVDNLREKGEADAPPRLPQIVIIVDELADLMMVAPGEVEESVCRLAQLARACGIHLIIATQRPSVDVITGLIKANMPSRVAFSVSSGVDSRTILDMVGAEKLLGKGDMLFYPQGYAKPARVQGAFVSDAEVSDVVDFLKNQAIGNVYAEEIEEKIQSMGSAGPGAGGDGGSSRDEYFAEAGKFIIEKDKASIGMLQRMFKIGFNRAARIMDQLSDYGVVGEEEGTKPRKVLMSMEQFESLLEEI